MESERGNVGYASIRQQPNDKNNQKTSRKTVYLY